MLSVSLLLTYVALASAARPDKSTQHGPFPKHATAYPEHPLFVGSQLTPSNFNSTIAKGIWFVEHLSPYCAHCRVFAPTWGELTLRTEDVQLAQVNCAVNGELCSANGITGYPQMNLYHDGVFIEQYKGTRKFDVLANYLAQKAASLRSPPLVLPAAPFEWKAEVVSLNPHNFYDILARGPAFVKFYTSWCGQCKRLAPTWIQLAAMMQGTTIIAEVECQQHRWFCAAQDVTKYPTLVYYHPGGPQSKYQGSHELQQLKSFVELEQLKPFAETASTVTLPNSPEPTQDSAQVVMHEPPAA